METGGSRRLLIPDHQLRSYNNEGRWGYQRPSLFSSTRLNIDCITGAFSLRYFKSTGKGTDMNAIAANDLKRHGISAVEQLLANGPVHIIKRNQPVCVILAEDEYEKLTRAAQSNTSVYSHTVMEWFALPAAGVATKEEIDQSLNAERNSWNTP
jgi:PHD/YefM family antitoxin component YafN of YafNO toxin-antitoxin module